MSIFSKTKKPSYLSRQDKRNVVATPQGWVRKLRTIDKFGNSRVRDIIINAVGNDDFSSGNNISFPTIDDLWHSATTIVHGNVVNTWISFNESITCASNMKFTVANTAGGVSTVVAKTPNTSVYGTNKLLFQWTPGTAGTYKIQAQTMANSTLTATNIKSINTGTKNANTVLSGVVSNTGGLVIVT